VSRSGWRRRDPAAKAATKADYGPAHRALRERLLADLAAHPGQPCPQTFADGTRCGKPMWTWQALHLGHTADRRGHIGLVHARCNLRAAAMRSNLRKGRGITTRVRPGLVRGRRPW
jgi:hypothetical protein